jgi:hypothetical protein
MVALVHGIVYARESHAREVDALQKARASIQAQLQVLKMELQSLFAVKGAPPPGVALAGL